MISWAAAGGLTSVVTLGLHAYAGYCALLMGAAKLVPKRPAAPEPRAEDLPRFLVIVPAHDEAAVIGHTVRSIRAADYPDGRLTVVVVADRCSDETAALARGAGALVIERFEGASGKSAAVARALADAPDFGTFDALVIFDADNAVAPQFFSAVARRLAAGEAVVQGRVDPKNPESSWVAASSALGFYAIAAVNQAPRERLGLSSPLMGTGWAARFDLGRDVLGSLTSLTDDLELAARLAERGVRVAYEEDAVVFDEKPIALGTAIGQRHRWMQGRWAVAAEHVPRLLGRALSRHEPRAVRLRALDTAIQLVAPSLFFTAVALGTVSAVDLVLRGVAPAAFVGMPRPPPLVSLAAAGLYYALPAPFVARLGAAPAVWRFYAVQPVYLALSFPLALTGFISRKSRLWRRTAHGTP